MRLEFEPNVAAFPLVENELFDNGAQAAQAELGWLLQTGIAAAQSGDRSRARELLLRAADVDPQSEEAWMWLASVSEYPEELLSFLDRVLDVNPENERAAQWRSQTKALVAKTFVQRAVVAYEEGSLETAAQCLDEAVAYDYNCELAWFWRASLANNDADKLECLRNVLEINPSNEEAREASEAIHRKQAYAGFDEAKSAAALGRRKVALDLVDEFLQTVKDSAEAWVLRSHLSLDLAEKMESLERALEIDPTNVAARANHEFLSQTVRSAPAAESYTEHPVVNLEPLAEAGDGPRFEVPADENVDAATETVERLADEDEQAFEHTVFNFDAEPAVEFSQEPVEEASASVEAAAERESESAEQPVDDHHQAFEHTVFNFDAESAVEFSQEPMEQASAPVEAAVEPATESAEQPSDDHHQAVEHTVFNFDAESSVEFSQEPGEEAMTRVEAAEAERAEYEEPAVEPPAFQVDAAESAPFVMAHENGLFKDDRAAEYLIDEEMIDETLNSVFPEHPAVVEALDPAERADVDGVVEMRASENAEPVLFEETVVFAVEAEEPAPEKPSLSLDDFAPAAEHDEPFELELPNRTVEEDAVVVATEQVGSPELPTVEASVMGYPCPYCAAVNEVQAFACSSCMATMTLSDIESLLANSRANREIVQTAVTKMEAESSQRAFTKEEMVSLSVGHFNLGNHQSGMQYLQEAARLDPNDVILGGQVNALAIRLEEMRRQDEVRGSMRRGKSILVVDDSPTVRKLIAGKLEKSGHSVMCASDGVEALEVLETELPDLVLLDITMPRKDGYEVCKEIRQNAAAANLPVVMISGKDGFFDKVRGRMAGATGYVTKPFGPETLMKALETYLLPDQE